MRTALRRALPALVLGWAGTSSALPDFVRTRRRRWPLQVALAGVAGALVAAAVSGPPEDGTEEDPQPDPALEAATPGGSGTRHVPEYSPYGGFDLSVDEQGRA